MFFSTKVFPDKYKAFSSLEHVFHPSSIVGVGHSSLVSLLAFGVGAGIETLKGLLTLQDHLWYVFRLNVNQHTCDENIN